MRPPAQTPEGFVCLGEIVGVHGVRGAVRIKSFAADEKDIAAYGPLRDASGERRFALTVLGTARGTVLCTIAGVDDRDAAAALQGTRLYLPRAALPELAEDEYYQADLIGLRAETADGKPYGRVVAVEDYGAGDVIEIERDEGPPTMVPFTRDIVPVVDVAGGRLVVVPPAETDADGESTRTEI